jgi:RNA polymerase sigma-70 factor (ECF subfamily)
MDSLDVYEVLVKQHKKMLFAYVLAMTPDTALAEDIVQEAFIIGYRKLSTLRDKERFAPWLRVIARNLILAELRKRGREVVLEPALLEGMEDVFCEEAQAGEGFEERVKVIETCFQKLPEKLHSVCRLHYFESQSAGQIARVLGVELGAVLKRLERSREAIRDCAEKGLGLKPVWRYERKP